MGSDNSKGKRQAEAAKYGQVFVQTDKTTYASGETVTGRVYLNIIQSYPGRRLLLKLKGKETTHEVREEKIGDLKYDTLFTDRQEILKITVPIHTFDSFVSGQYVVPFAFLLPPNLPNTFHQVGHRYLGNISYRLEAMFEPESEKTHPKLKYKQDLVVRNMLDMPTQTAPQELRTRITTCCCCCESDKGSNVLNVHFEKSWYSPGEVAQVMISVDNSASTLDVVNVNFALLQKLSITAKGAKINRDHIVVSSVLQRINKGDRMAMTTVTLQLPPLQEGNYSMAKRSDMKGYLQGVYPSNQIMHCATKSKNISSEYLLEVYCNMDACCCVSKPIIQIPIQIYHPDVQMMTVNAPTNWNPVEMDNVNVSMGAPLDQKPMTTASSDQGYAGNMGMGSNTMGNVGGATQENQYQPPPQYDNGFGQQQYGQNYYS